MKKSILIKSCFVACILSFSVVGQSKAVDLAGDSVVMEAVESMVASVKARLVDAALNGDADTVLEIQKREAAVDSAVTAARNAFAKVELHVRNGDVDAADTAEEELVAAWYKVRDALMGAVSELAVDGDSNDESDSAPGGGGPGSPDDPPNPHEKPWGPPADILGELFGDFWDASAFGHGQGLDEFEATPE